MSRTLFVLATSVLGILGLAGCATMSVEQRTAFCTNTDWYRYGLNDGTLGIRSSERADIIADCAEVGHPVDATAYQAGRAEGLREYCTVENGYDVGYSGRKYQNVCPPELEADFLQGYAQGRDDRPSYAVYPGIGIGIGSGRVSTGVGIGIGIGNYYGYDDCYRDPFLCGWRRPWGYPWGYRYPYRYPYPYYRSHRGHSRPPPKDTARPDHGHPRPRTDYPGPQADYPRRRTDYPGPQADYTRRRTDYPGPQADHARPHADRAPRQQSNQR